MPDDVAERLTVALGAFHHAPAPAQEGRHLHAVPSRSSAGAARSRRLRRWAVPVSAAAGVLAFAGFGANYLISGEEQTGTAGSAPGNASAQNASTYSGAVPPAAGNAAVAVSRVNASGLNYEAGSLGVRALSSKSTDKGTEREPAQVAELAGPVDPALQRLVPRPALIACLTAISAEHGTPLDAEVVDYARYEGAPALIVRFTAPDGEWAWVSGPDCGAPGAATVTSVKVG
jgi:hypothetical protein